MYLYASQANDIREGVPKVLILRPDKAEKNINNNEMEAYHPQPIDLSDVELEKDLTELIEPMAKNVHEVWAKSRIGQGWTYGEKRNDELKLHPCLIPYEDLPEVEKDYDRNTAIGTLKLIKYMGFKISR